jgi:hypothetical protein
VSPVKYDMVFIFEKTVFFTVTVGKTSNLIAYNSLVVIWVIA